MIRAEWKRTVVGARFIGVVEGGSVGSMTKIIVSKREGNGNKGVSPFVYKRAYVKQRYLDKRMSLFYRQFAL